MKAVKRTSDSGKIYVGKLTECSPYFCTTQRQTKLSRDVESNRKEVAILLLC